ncbi:MAG TPA: hypothetical protein VFB31_19365 [Pseudolabrys sp.]|nr:hypothetical protein [Pseudolabrys sp.]
MAETLKFERSSDLVKPQALKPWGDRAVLEPGLSHCRCRPGIDRDRDLTTQVHLNTAGAASMKKALPEKMFGDNDQPRLTTLRNWVLENDVTEIEMSERQFWNFAQLQPIAEKPWVTFMGRQLRVPNMPADAQKRLGIDDKAAPGAI